MVLQRTPTLVFGGYLTSANDTVGQTWELKNGADNTSGNPSAEPLVVEHAERIRTLIYFKIFSEAELLFNIGAYLRKCIFQYFLYFIIMPYLNSGF